MPRPGFARPPPRAVSRRCKADPIADQAPGREAVGDLVQVDRLEFERAPQPFDEDIVHEPAPAITSRYGCQPPGS